MTESVRTETIEVGGEPGLAIRATGLGVRLPKGRGVERLWSVGHWAFRNVNFELRRGETVALIGRNGSGKSTLMRTLARILEPDEGTLAIAPGLTSTILAPGAGFDTQMTGRENLFQAALYQGFLPAEIEDRVDDIIAFSELGVWVDQPLAIYSAGMRARLGFSLSLYLPADILMIDETLSAGDVTFRDKARLAVRDLIASDRTVVLVSHNRETMREMCSKGLILDRGQQVAEGPIEEVLGIYDDLMSVPALSAVSPAIGAIAAEDSGDKIRSATQEKLEALQKIRTELQARRRQWGDELKGLRESHLELAATVIDSQSRVLAALSSAPAGPSGIDGELAKSIEDVRRQQEAESRMRAHVAGVFDTYLDLLTRERTMLAEIHELRGQR